MGIYVKTTDSVECLDYVSRIKSLETAVTKLQNKVMSLQKYEITLYSGNVNVSNSYLNCYRFGNIVMVEGTVNINKSIAAYHGLSVAKTFPIPATTKTTIFYQPCSTDGEYASVMSSIGQDGVLSLNARFKSISANLSSWLQFCYICK